MTIRGRGRGCLRIFDDAIEVPEWVKKEFDADGLRLFIGNPKDFKRKIEEKELRQELSEEEPT